MKNALSKVADFFSVERLIKVFVVGMLLQGIMLGILYKEISDTQQATQRTSLANQEILKTVRFYTSPKNIKDTEDKITSLVVAVKCDNQQTAQRLLIALVDKDQKKVSILSKECQKSN